MQSIKIRHTSEHTKRGSLGYLLAAALLMSMSNLAQAVPLNLTLNPFPDIVSTFISVDYTAGTDVFTARGFADELNDDGSVPAEAIADGTFDLVASISDLGIMSSGSLSIGGTIASLGYASGTLLTGDLTSLGFNNAGDPLEFLFDVTGGDAFALYGSGAIDGGIILSFSGFTGDWTSDFSTNAAAADVGTVPAPAAVWLFGSGLIGLLGFGRQASRKQNS